MKSQFKTLMSVTATLTLYGIGSLPGACQICSSTANSLKAEDNKHMSLVPACNENRTHGRGEPCSPAGGDAPPLPIGNLCKPVLASSFSKKVESTLRAADTASEARTVNRLTGVIGANAQMTLHSDQYIKLGRLKGYVVDVKNETDRALIFDGDNATVTSGSAMLSVASISEVASVPMPQKGLLRNLVEGAAATVIGGASIGSVPAALDVINQAGPVEHRYGADQARRMDEQSRFGRRILFPGESTSGVIYFKKSASRQFSKNIKTGYSSTKNESEAPSITLPVSLLYDDTDKDSIVE